jgi:DNA/RNA-binding domain of Phe-tRNA-synthetase-like protein
MKKGLDMCTVSEAWKAAFTDAHIGILIMKNVRNPRTHEVLNKKKEELEQELGVQYDGKTKGDLKKISTIAAYQLYYKKFKKTYHVLLQLESVAIKGKPLPTANTLVESMFMAELKNLLLTAGHDYDKIKQPITGDVSRGNEEYILMNGNSQVLKPGDMFIKDSQGIISSVIYGPDKRTKITLKTQNVLFVIYAPAGITEEEIYHHLEDIVSYINLFSPDTQVVKRCVLK